MARREGNREQTIEMLSEKVAEFILELVVTSMGEGLRPEEWDFD